MLDPISALSVAAAVVQFVDFASSLLSDANEAFHSVRGLSAGDLGMEQVYEKLQELNEYLAGFETTPTTDPNFSTSDLQRQDAALKQLSINCRSDCESLLGIIQSCILNGEKHRRWKSIKMAMKTAMSKRTKADLQQRIESAQTTMSLYLQSLLRTEIVGLKVQLGDMRDEAKALRTDQVDKIVALRKRFEELALGEMQGEAEQAQAPQAKLRSLSEVIDALSLALTTKDQIAKEQAILSSLRFKSRPVRHAAIVEAHAETFQWIFQSKLSDWLREGDGVFWITGKAGSGKSTLMKFVADHPTTRSILDQWAAPMKALIGCHYFWSPGTDMQKSQQGLLQSLLFDLFRQFTSLIPIASPKRWDRRPSELKHLPWTICELSDTLREVANHEENSMRICLFIDGLDEFAGDHLDLCEIVRDLARSKQLKICVSSRPWNEFLDEFGNNPSRSISIHHFTLEDIQKFAQSRLESHPRWKECALEEKEKPDLVKEIGTRAEGVFLWAFLVTRSLREGLSNDDTIQDLNARLRSLPTDLERLFKQMLDGVNPIYHEKMAAMFQIATRSNGPLRWEVYYHHEREYADRRWVLNLPVAGTRWDDLCKYQHQTARRINARSRGLLSLDSSDGDQVRRVQFLHRTVCDFLRTDEMEDYFSSKAKIGFDVYCSIFRAYVAWIKCTSFVFGMEVGLGQDIFALCREALSYAVQGTEQSSHGIPETIDEFERVITTMAKASKTLAIKFNRRPRAAQTVFRQLLLEVGLRGDCSGNLPKDSESDCSDNKRLLMGAFPEGTKSKKAKLTES